MTPAEARAEVEQIAENVTQDALTVLREKESLPLREMLDALLMRGYPLEFVSRALTRLLFAGTVVLTGERALVLPRAVEGSESDCPG